MKHYVCMGDCAAESDKPGVCRTPGCSHEGKAFTACRCQDGEHEGALKIKETSEEKGE